MENLPTLYKIAVPLHNILKDVMEQHNDWVLVEVYIEPNYGSIVAYFRRRDDDPKQVKWKVVEI